MRSSNSPDLDSGSCPASHSCHEEITRRDSAKRDELRANRQEIAEIKRHAELQQRAAELDRLIFAALLEQSIRHPERLDEAQLLAWKMPTPFTIELNETLDAVQHAHGIEIDEINSQILDYEMHAGKAFLAGIDIQTPIPPRPLDQLQRQRHEHENEMAKREPVIFADERGIEEEVIFEHMYSRGNPRGESRFLPNGQKPKPPLQWPKPKRPGEDEEII